MSKNIQLRYQFFFHCNSGTLIFFLAGGFMKFFFCGFGGGKKKREGWKLVQKVAENMLMDATKKLSTRQRAGWWLTENTIDRKYNWPKTQLYKKFNWWKTRLNKKITDTNSAGQIYNRSDTLLLLTKTRKTFATYYSCCWKMLIGNFCGSIVSAKNGRLIDFFTLSNIPVVFKVLPEGFWRVVTFKLRMLLLVNHP